ncbi:3-phosphoshikimate 1-carboxyvinyltransferase [Enterobacteriaceae endosymbiont of Macroplea appendiculata]|uniref:3-phosphoshikimate 1-carboxyvinyltransferase n=1 Tax=Enterobacteriaceae endosymbiont of Macroplea appendiculata TaxID=2675790 RepID=UPI0014499182|nr:3-phosphoshikimate 1-carboxyvinyltransferase [Enterobacteriaceae endosymbiont of Macroplea appendiculata]QJC30898.1 3-phosphoshikimate 1-carboxyvinyltransferase [Enterobacteriaceae endosymbiont of Macroplea appendiculata]
MKKILTLYPIKKINGTVTLPGSKSISNRALLLASLAKGKTNLINLLDSDDTRYMIQALKMCGINIQITNNNCYIIGNNGVFNTKNNMLYVGNAGTVFRPLTAILSLNIQCNITITGESRMKERPIKHLVDVLRSGGAKIIYLEKQNYPPLKLYGGFLGKKKLIIDGSISSQFLTSLLIISPLMKHNTVIYIKNNLVSKPYIDITIALMKKFGVMIDNDNYQKFIIYGNQRYYSPGEYIIEGDASSASYFLSAAAIKGGTVTLYNINKYSIQGDMQYVSILEKMGAKIFYGDNYITCQYHKTLKAIQMDMNHIPDVAMTIAVTSLFAQGTTIISNIYNWRVKETDRLAAMTTELRKTGAYIIEGKDYIIIQPPITIPEVTIETYNDHRMAMCFTLLSLSNVIINIINPNCINKTYPNYFKDFKKISLYK